MPNIGVETIGASWETVEASVVGSPITMTETGTVDSVTAHLRDPNENHAISAVVYEDGADTTSVDRIDQDGTGRNNIAASGTWETFSGFAGSSLLDAASYLPMVWGSGGGGSIDIAFDDTADGNDGNQWAAAAYSLGANFADPETISNASSIYSIYITYTVAGVGASKLVVLNRHRGM